MALAKKIFYSLYIIDITCFDKFFSFHMITRGYCFFFKVYFYPEAFCNHYILAFFQTSNLKEVCIFCLISTIAAQVNTKVPKWSSRISYLLNFRNYWNYLMLLILFWKISKPLKKYFLWNEFFVPSNSLYYSYTYGYVNDLDKVRTRALGTFRKHNYRWYWLQNKTDQKTQSKERV